MRVHRGARWNRENKEVSRNSNYPKVKRLKGDCVEGVQSKERIAVHEHRRARSNEEGVGKNSDADWPTGNISLKCSGAAHSTFVALELERE